MDKIKPVKKAKLKKPDFFAVGAYGTDNFQQCDSYAEAVQVAEEEVENIRNDTGDEEPVYIYGVIAMVESTGVPPPVTVTKF